MFSFDEKVGAPQPTDKEYVEIIRSDVEVDPKYIQGTGAPARIVYFCPECKKLIAPKRIGNKFRFKCADCKCDEVAFGTEESIINYYRIKELQNKKQKNSDK